jgi:hypothetical protein
MAVLCTRRDDGNATPGNVVSVFLEPRHLVFNCRTDGGSAFSKLICNGICMDGLSGQIRI